MNEILTTIVETFAQRGGEKYADEGVSQLQHALQCAALARQEQADSTLVVAALLHDIGHILGRRGLPENCQEDLDDRHEQVGYAFLKRNFGAAVSDPVRLHVAAKRYLCTKERSYQQRLSPTSYKSFLDQGGMMSAEELFNFEDECYFHDAVRLRVWDDTAKDPDLIVPDIQDYLAELESLVLAQTK